MTRTLPGRRRSRVLLFLVAGAALCSNQPASAQGSPPPPLPGDAAVDQYREALPSGAGPVAPGAGKPEVAPLAAPLRERLLVRGGRDAELLERIATSSEYGAPQRTAGSDAGDALRGRPDRASRGPESRRGNPASAAVTALRDGIGGRVGLLLFALLLVTGSLVAASARQGRFGPKGS